MSDNVPEKKQSSDKRKAGDLSPDTEPGQPRLRRRGSLPDLHSAADPKKTFSLPELITKGFKDPDIVKDIVPSILNFLRPSIEATISKSIEKSMTSCLNTAVETALCKFKEEVMDPQLQTKDKEIQFLKGEIDLRDQQIETLQNSVAELESSVGKLSKGLNDIEQYGRRQSIRLNNVKLDDEPKCEEVVIKILNKALPIGDSIQQNDIERCHPIGKPNSKNNRQVIVKFKAYKTKAKVYDSRFNLRNIYMTEDFTSSNQKIINKLVIMKKSKQITKFWSYDGKIYAKAHAKQPKWRITKIEDISEMIISAADADYDESEVSDGESGATGGTTGVPFDVEEMTGSID